MTEIGAQLVALMRARDLQPKEVAAMINRSRKTYYNFINGRASAKVEAQVLLAFPSLRTITHQETK